MVVINKTPRDKQPAINKPAEVNNTKNNKSNKSNNTKNNKSKRKPVEVKNKNKTNPDEEDDKGPLDEKGNPLPLENPEGGDPVCVGGYKIDYQFDPINDPINPPFRCITALKDPTDGIAGKLLAMANNPSSGVGNLAATGNVPGIGGKRRRKTIRRKKRNDIFNIRRRHRHTRHHRG